VLPLERMQMHTTRPQILDRVIQPGPVLLCGLVPGPPVVLMPKPYLDRIHRRRLRPPRLRLPLTCLHPVSVPGCGPRHRPAFTPAACLPSRQLRLPSHAAGHLAKLHGRGAAAPRLGGDDGCGSVQAAFSLVGVHHHEGGVGRQAGTQVGGANGPGPRNRRCPRPLPRCGVGRDRPTRTWCCTDRLWSQRTCAVGLVSLKPAGALEASTKENAGARLSTSVLGQYN